MLTVHEALLVAPAVLVVLPAGQAVQLGWGLA